MMKGNMPENYNLELYHILTIRNAMDDAHMAGIRGDLNGKVQALAEVCDCIAHLVKDTKTVEDKINRAITELANGRRGNASVLAREACRNLYLLMKEAGIMKAKFQLSGGLEAYRQRRGLGGNDDEGREY